jgi:hypothetical protein
VTSLFGEKILCLLNLNHEIVPNGLRDCAAWVADFALNCVVPSGLNDLFTFLDSSVDVLTERLHDLCPFFVHCLTHIFFILLTARCSLVAGGQKLATLTFDLCKCSISDQTSMVFDKGFSNGIKPSIDTRLELFKILSTVGDHGLSLTREAGFVLSCTLADTVSDNC